LQPRNARFAPITAKTITFFKKGAEMRFLRRWGEEPIGEVFFSITPMALAIQPIPVLRGKEADDFARKIDYNETHNSGKINFTEQKKMLKSILDNAKL
jgi:hypothetical protein